MHPSFSIKPKAALLAIGACLMVGNAQLKTTCPVSRSSADILNNNNLFSYPYDVYATSSVEEPPPNAVYIPCYALDFGNKFIFNHTQKSSMHNCSIPSVCPWLKENVEYATKDLMGMKTVLSANFCRITSKLFSFKDKSVNETINIYILGGSVTRGQGTAGYECEVGLVNGHIQCVSPKQYHGGSHILRSRQFSWWKYFELWLQSITNITVVMHDLSGSGHSSAVSSNDLTTYLKHKKHYLSSNDIIFLDFSINDGMDLCYHEDGCRSLNNALKQFLVTIQDNCLNCITLPPIILFETFPHPHTKEGGKTRSPIVYDTLKDILAYSHNYLSVYHKFSTMFNIPKWSFYNVVWSKDFKIRQDPFFGAYFKWYKGIDQHPPWHIHLAIADLYASAFLYESRRCQQNQKMMKEIIIPKDIPRGDTCDSNRYAKSILDITSSMCPSWEYMIGNVTYISVSQNTWQFQDDGKGRYGWMIQNIQNTPSHPSTTTNMSPDITITSRSNSSSTTSSSSVLSSLTTNTAYTMNNATITFYTKFYLDRLQNPMTPTTPEKRKKPYSLDIYYLRSYENFGLADVYLDNVYLTTLDGLWDDLSKHVSVPQLYTTVLPIGSQPESISIIYRPINCHQLNTSSSSTTTPTSGDDIKRCYTRKFQKMRIIGVRICSPK